LITSTPELDPAGLPETYPGSLGTSTPIAPFQSLPSASDEEHFRVVLMVGINAIPGSFVTKLSQPHAALDVMRKARGVVAAKQG
jgi:hypothetical protein